MLATPLSGRRTKIVATLGPATYSPEAIRKLIESGMDVARINSSHGDHESHGRTIAMVREQARAVGKPVGILFDLQGPKIRIGKFDGQPREVRVDDVIELAVGRPALGNEYPSDYPLLDRDVQPGHPLLIDDGNVGAEVIHVEPGLVKARIKNDGVIGPRKGINLPASNVSAPAISEKDRKDAIFAVSQHVDTIALSFVRRAEDVLQLRDLLAEHGAKTPIVAKIEKPQALDNLRGILEVSWGVMVARGDLGVELSPEEVPMAQKRIIREANRLGRPVITATQMLDSMTRNPRPTRAEASDVANAVIDGTDAVMLSQETAAGRYPFETVEMMSRIIGATERVQMMAPQYKRRERGLDTISKAVIDAGAQVAYSMQASAIVAFTLSGTTAVLASQRRPTTPIIAFTPRPEVCNLLQFVWGVRPHVISAAASTDRILEELDVALLEHQLAQRGDRLVVLMGSPTNRHGPTNVMMVHHVGSTGLTSPRE